MFLRILTAIVILCGFILTVADHSGTYVRWGRKTCPGYSIELVYSGRAGGSSHIHSGAAANYICLPKDPEYYNTSSSIRKGAFVYGAEYAENYASVTSGNDVPCAVCRPTTRGTIMMIPGRKHCFKNWHTEYQGYLSTGYYGDKAASEYVCLDEGAQSVTNSSGYNNGKLFYRVAAECDSLPCPPYDEEQSMACVVCSR